MVWKFEKFDFWVRLAVWCEERILPWVDGALFPQGTAGRLWRTWKQASSCPHLCRPSSPWRPCPTAPLHPSLTSWLLCVTPHKQKKDLIAFWKFWYACCEGILASEVCLSRGMQWWVTFQTRSWLYFFNPYFVSQNPNRRILTRFFYVSAERFGRRIWRPS